MAGHCTVLCDGYDREAFQKSLRLEPALASAKARADRLLPRGEALLCDLFSALFKLNVVLQPVETLSASVRLNRRLVQGVLASAAFADLRVRTQLSRPDAAAATVVLVDRALSALTKEYQVNAAALAEADTAAEDEAKLEALEAQRDALSEIGEQAFDETTRDDLAETIGAEIDELKGQIDAAKQSQSDLADRLTSELDASIQVKLGQLPEQLDQVAAQMKSLGLGGNADGGAQRSLQLGERLLRSKKLQMLAKLVGAFREVAMEARRRRVARVPQEVHSVERGRQLDHLLGSELLGLSRARPALHREFLRRFAEGELLQYELHGAASRGPMVVCVDGSGSMSGSKEIWAKAVALTLMEIARREKRRCLAIVFSSRHEMFEVELLSTTRSRGSRAAVAEKEVLDFAEYFPGGGTDFEAPLTRAVDAVSDGRYRRGDIVFITDGEASVSEALVARIDEARRRHRFKIRGILVDLSHSRLSTLSRFCDEIQRVSDITGASMTDLFAAV